MRIDAGLIAEPNLMQAIKVEITQGPALLPPSTLALATLGHESDLAEWTRTRVTSGFVPTPQEVVAASKQGHGLRPIGLWDSPTRVSYGSLVDRLRATLNATERGPDAWAKFQRAPLSVPGDYIVLSDIAACYDSIDHGLLADELIVQSGDVASVDALMELAHAASGRRYGLPQQSRSSDVLAEVFLAKLQRALVRRGLTVFRFNDDFRFTCSRWSDVVITIEALVEEARELGLNVNDLKTMARKRDRYEASLDGADKMRQQIATEAELDLTQYEAHPYTLELVEVPPDVKEVDLLAARRVVERWDGVAGRGRVAERRKSEHRAVMGLLPLALSTLAASPDTDGATIRYCMKMLRVERSMTPAVCRYLATRTDEDLLLAEFDRMLGANAYLNGWQTWWLQAPLARLEALPKGAGHRRRLAWLTNALSSGETSPIVRASVTLTLARHQLMDLKDVLARHRRANDVSRPTYIAAAAFLKPTSEIADALRGDDPLQTCVFDWAQAMA